MLRGKRIGLIVWGIIFLFVSLALYSVGNGFASAVASINLIGALLMIIFGIVNVVSATKYNNLMLRQNLHYNCVCPSCAKNIDCDIKSFRRHGNFPEGFVYCPVCKHPISRNLFNVTRED